MILCHPYCFEQALSRISALKTSCNVLLFVRSLDHMTLHLGYSTVRIINSTCLSLVICALPAYCCVHLRVSAVEVGSVLCFVSLFRLYLQQKLLTILEGQQIVYVLQIFCISSSETIDLYFFNLL